MRTLLTILFIYNFCNVFIIGKKPNIIFLMVDEMDGRNMDKESPDQYNPIQMPNLRNLASKGTQFVGHYTNGPQCVCGRSVLWTGIRTNNNHVYNNGFGIAAMSNGTLDQNCIACYNREKCENISNIQSINFTIFDAMKSVYGLDNMYFVGKLHVGNGIMNMPIGANLTFDAFQNASNTFGAITRSSNILSKWGNESNNAGPIRMINDTFPNPHAQDQTFAAKCIERLNNLGNDDERLNNSPFFLYCSISAPHPPYHTNSTWLKGVNIDEIVIPNWNRTNYNEHDRYSSINQNLWNENYSNKQFIDFRKTYYGLNVEADYLMGQVINASFLNGFNLSNTYFIFTSDHGEMNLDHREILKNSMYEGSARIPLFMVGPNISSNLIISNFTETVDILPTLLSLVSQSNDNIPPWLEGSTLMPFLNGNINNNKHPNYITSQYHSLRANTGLFMVRKGKYKYIQYGHYLKAYKNYKPQLFNLDNDPNELNDISNSNQNIVNEMENILLNRYNYEYVDCVAKQSDMSMFNEFIWDIYNQSEIYSMFESVYKGFNETDWENVKKWRIELTNSPQCQP